MPPRIKKWVIEMQDYELLYEPGKDEKNLLDLFPDIPCRKQETITPREIIRWTLNTEHAVVIDRVRQETHR